MYGLLGNVSSSKIIRGRGGGGGEAISATLAFYSVKLCNKSRTHNCHLYHTILLCSNQNQRDNLRIRIASCEKALKCVTLHEITSFLYAKSCDYSMFSREICESLS